MVVVLHSHATTQASTVVLQYTKTTTKRQVETTTRKTTVAASFVVTRHKPWLRSFTQETKLEPTCTRKVHTAYANTQHKTLYSNTSISTNKRNIMHGMLLYTNTNQSMSRTAARRMRRLSSSSSSQSQNVTCRRQTQSSLVSSLGSSRHARHLSEVGLHTNENKTDRRPY